MYEIDNSKQYKGICIKNTFTFSASGGQAPAFVTMLGLSLDNLPKEKVPNGILKFPLEDLFPGGSGVNVGLERGTGHIVLSETTKTGKKIRTGFVCIATKYYFLTFKF